MDEVEHQRRMQFIVSQLYKSFEDYKMELFQLECKYFEINSRLNRERDFLRNILIRKHKTKAISKTQSEAHTEDVCAICMDKHRTIDTIVTNCKHQFGQECFHRWVNTKEGHVYGVPCPVCKGIITMTTSFRHRVYVKRAATAAVTAVPVSAETGTNVGDEDDDVVFMENIVSS